ncbi:HNH endonuclease [Natronomonas sp. EA1]|uniref:HNH endonuclease n=1 Tax=Natronomonas sp. EA1 TaxID=3421655 RepID=UPI003EBB9973
MPTCPTCGIERDSWQKLRLHHLSAHDESLPNRECTACSTAFYSETGRKYCSEACRNANRRDVSGQNNPNYTGAKTETQCVTCGATFAYYPSEKEGLYCPACVASGEWQTPPRLEGKANPRWRGGKVEVGCAVCDAPVERYPSEIEGEVVCGEACRREWLSEAFTGEGHPNWKGGPVGSYGGSWARARRRALERDGYACTRCGRSREDLGRNPDVHHVVPVRRFLEHSVTTVADAHTLDNLVTLCPACHRRVES